MLNITRPDQLKNYSNSVLILLVNQRFFELGDITIHIIETGDNVSDIESILELPILTNLFDGITSPDPDFMPCFEALEDHGDFYEMLFILGDGEEAIEIFIPKSGIDPELLSMCADFSNQPEPYSKEIIMTTSKNHNILPIDPLISEIYETLTDNLKEEFHERAAIIEFESNIPRDNAERQAMDAVLAKMNAEK